MPDQPSTRHGRRLWEIPAVRDLALVALALAVLFALFWLRAILAPIVLAFALAYIVDPVVRALRGVTGARRVTIASVGVAVVLAGGVVFVGWFGPVLVDQTEALVERVVSFVETNWDPHQSAAATQPAATQPTATQPTPRADADAAERSASETADAVLDQLASRRIADHLLTSAGRAFGFAGTVLSTVAYLSVSAVLVAVLFVYFTANYERLFRVEKFFPASQRDTLRDALHKIDIAFSGYVRGQVVVALFTTIGFCVGFWLVDVPNWFVVALIGGVLSLIPYGQLSGWVLAVTLKYIETQTGDASFSWIAVVVGPTLVYAVTQSMETWVITPWVQGESVNLHPVTVIVVLLVGGSIAGVVGLILAIPVAATLRMLFVERWGPWLERWAREH